MKKSTGWENLKHDIPAGIVVFLVALPLCLGIALASGAPLFSGIIAGIIGGIVVGFFSGSQLSVSGPAAGLAVIVFSSIEKLQSFELFCMAVILAGIFQLFFGYIKAGVIGHFFPSSVIKGMLASIGIMLILKQIPHALGDDADIEGDEEFFQPDGENTFSELIVAFQNFNNSALIIAFVSLVILLLWERPQLKKFSFFKVVPGSLLVVIIGAFINQLYIQYAPNMVLNQDHMVNLPQSASFSQFFSSFSFPDFSGLLKIEVYLIAITIALIASLESLLSLEATDKLDPFRRIAPPNQELKAQGVGNIISGFLGGLPITSVIVRSTANVSSGARSKNAAIFHGILLLMAVAFFPLLMNKIPLSALAAILILVGYKLAKPKLFFDMYRKGKSQFIPFIVTVLAVLFSDLLIGISIGLSVGIYFVIRSNFHKSVTIINDGNRYLIKLSKDVSFLNRGLLRDTLEKIPYQSTVIIDGSKSNFIDHDIEETIIDYQDLAPTRDITVIYEKDKNKKLTTYING